MIPPLLDGLRQGDRRSLSRLLTLVSRGEGLAEIARLLPAPAKTSKVIAITGGAGVGKSTLIGKLLDQVRQAGLRTAVLACDPQSPLTGGALLGDRVRMAGGTDEAIFIRSLAAPHGREALAEHLDWMIRILEVFGFDWIVIETVGAGQGDVAGRSLVDVLVLLVQPEAGDELQYEKAGLLEVADLIVLQKADLPGADQALAQVQSSLEIARKPMPTILKVSARTGQGIVELFQTLHGWTGTKRKARSPARELFQLTLQKLAQRLDALEKTPTPAYQKFIEDFQTGQGEKISWSNRLLDLLKESHGY